MAAQRLSLNLPVRRISACTFKVGLDVQKKPPYAVAFLFLASISLNYFANRVIPARLFLAIAGGADYHPARCK